MSREMPVSPRFLSHTRKELPCCQAYLHASAKQTMQKYYSRLFHEITFSSVQNQWGRLEKGHTVPPHQKTHANPLWKNHPIHAKSGQSICGYFIFPVIYRSYEIATRFEDSSDNSRRRLVLLKPCPITEIAVTASKDSSGKDVCIKLATL